MRAGFRLNEDVNARCIQMTLFFFLMPSRYNETLKFPFDYKVTFCLFDQSPAQRHIIHSFRPDTNSDGSQRPRSDMLIAMDIPGFCALSTIEQEGNGYVQDNTMFIEVMVDYGNMSPSLLQYKLSLYRPLPTNIQISTVREEENRRKQTRLATDYRQSK